MKTYYFLLFIGSIVLLTFQNCTKPASPDTIHISAHQLRNPESKLSNIIENIEFVKLQDGQLYPQLASEIIMLDPSGIARDNFKAYKDCFLLLNSEKQIDVYDKNGFYKFHFGQQGRGSGEYIYPNDFCYNANTHQFAVASREGLFLYDSSGVFVKHIPYENHHPSISKIEFISSDQFIITGSIREKSNYSFFFIDSSGHIELQPYITEEPTIFSRFYQYQDSILFLHNDSLFITQNNHPILYKSFDFPPQLTKDLRIYRESKNWRMFHAIEENFEGFILVLSSKNKPITHIISSKTQDDCFLNIGKGAFGFIIDAWDIIDERIVVTIPASEFKAMVEKAKQHPEQYPYFKQACQIADQLNEDSNHIIAWVTLKEV